MNAEVDVAYMMANVLEHQYRQALAVATQKSINFCAEADQVGWCAQCLRPKRLCLGCVRIVTAYTGPELLATFRPHSRDMIAGPFSNEADAHAFMSVTPETKHLTYQVKPLSHRVDNPLFNLELKLAQRYYTANARET